MVRGIITAKHIILHPITIISNWGIKVYIRMLASCLSSGNHCFTDFIFHK